MTSSNLLDVHITSTKGYHSSFDIIAHRHVDSNSDFTCYRMIMHVCKQRFGLDLQTELRCDSHSFKSLRYESCPADVEHVLCQACSICDSQ